jgi:ABC-type amino acid transport substrate-binding protein
MLVLLLAVFSGCADSAGRNEPGAVRYASFRDIPGVTEEEIAEIEAFIERGVTFTLGMHPTTEIFEAGGEIRGYAALLCEYLTGLFCIPFEPMIVEWGELLAGLESREIDFTATLTPTEERKNAEIPYFMTGAIAGHTVKYFRIAGSRPFREIEAQRPLRYAFLDGAVTFGDVASHIDYVFEPFFVNGYTDAYNMLKNGDIDAFFDENPAEAEFDIYGDVVSYDFFPLIYSPVSLTTQKPELEPVIKVVQKALESGVVRYLTELYNHGQREYTKHKLFMKFTEEEISDMHNNPEI